VLYVHVVINILCLLHCKRSDVIS